MKIRLAPVVGVTIVLGAMLGGAAAPGARAQAPKREPAEMAHNARVLEELGAYAQAAEALRALEKTTAADADLSLAIALDEARSGDLESASTRLWGPLLSRAIQDTLPVSRRREYPWSREQLWLNGKFDGWHWYVARARAEVAARRGNWNDALEAARLCVNARPLAGKEWLLLAFCAAHAGDSELALSSAARAAFLDPTLPEAPYLLGLFEWKAKRRGVAQGFFRTAVTIDSTYHDAARALVRAQLPFGEPDPLPLEFLSGVRRPGLLTSTARPKADEFVQMDRPAELIKQGQFSIPDTLPAGSKPIKLGLPVLVDERGHVVLHELPWFDQSALPESAIGGLLTALLDTRFRPATKRDEPYPVWAALEFTIAP